MADKDSKRAPAKAVFVVYWGYLKKHPVYFGLVVAMGLVLQGASLAAPLYLREFFNLLVAHGSIDALMGALFMVGLFWFINWLASRVQDFNNMYLGAQVMSELYQDAFSYLLGHSYNFFISNFAGSLTHKVSRYARAFEVISDGILLQFFPAFVFVAGAVGVLFVHNAWLGSALLIWSVLFVTFQIFVTRLRQPLRAQRSEADTKITATLADAIANQSTIAQFAGITHERGIFNTVVQAWRTITIRYWFADAWIFAGIGLFVIAIQLLLLYGAVVFWARGLLTVGDFVLIQTYVLGIFGQLMGINFQLRRFYDAFADAGEMVAILQSPHEVKDRRNAKALAVTNGEVWFDNVNFGFGKRTVLTDFNLKIQGGERVALVGPSGAGKSTVTKLLLRLYNLPEGQVLVDGHNIADVTQDSLREAIAFVPQEPILFHRTLMENIRYGRRDATDQEVVAAAKLAHCHEFITHLSDGYYTFVGERGIKLSGGERQRVAIARAILKNAPILVLDEATSSLDSESEALIQDALETLMQGKTVIVIAHRLSTIMKMDRIVVMEGGSVVAMGSHLELIREKGLYQKLWNIQAGGFLADGGGEDDPVLDEVTANEDGTIEELAEEGEEQYTKDNNG